MTSNFAVRPTMRVLTSTDFLGSGTIARATHEKLASTVFPNPELIHSSTTAERANGGVRITHTTTLSELSEKHAIAHRFHFIDRTETRERFHVVTPDQPSATTELLVMFDEGQSRDYFSVSTYDNKGVIAATETLVYNDEGKIVAYPFGDQLVSPLSVRDAHLEEVAAEDGRRVLRFEVTLGDLEEEVKLALLWESIGSIQRHPVTCGPESPVASIEMPLEGNSGVYPCDWVAIAVDAEERVLAQAHFALEAE